MGSVSCKITGFAIKQYHAAFFAVLPYTIFVLFIAMQHGRKIQEVTMREINWKKLVGAVSAAVLAATQVAPAITAYAEEADTTDYGNTD